MSFGHASAPLVAQGIFDLLRMGAVVAVLGVGNTDIVTKPTTARLGCLIAESVFSFTTLSSCLGYFCSDKTKWKVYGANLVIGAFSGIGAALLGSDLKDATNRPEAGMIFIAMSIMASKFKDLCLTPSELGGLSTHITVGGNAMAPVGSRSQLNTYVFCPCPGSRVLVAEPVAQTDTSLLSAGNRV